MVAERYALGINRNNDTKKEILKIKKRKIMGHRMGKMDRVCVKSWKRMKIKGCERNKMMKVGEGASMD